MTPQRFVGQQHILLRIAPVCPRDCLQNLVAAPEFVNSHFDVGAKSEVRIEGHPKNLGVFYEGEQGTTVKDLRMVMVLVRVSREESHA